RHPEGVGGLARRAGEHGQLDDLAGEAEGGDRRLDLLGGRLQRTSSAMVRTASVWAMPQIIVVTPDPVHRASPSLMRSRGPHQATSSTSASGTAAAASAFRPDR